MHRSPGLRAQENRNSSESQHERSLAIRIVSLDYYYSQPISGLDPTHVPRDGARIPKVCVLRVFGSTPSGQAACIHVHQVRPRYVALSTCGRSQNSFGPPRSTGRACRSSRTSTCGVGHAYPVMKRPCLSSSTRSTSHWTSTSTKVCRRQVCPLSHNSSRMTLGYRHFR